ncbi:MAG: ATP synthase F0 subunit C [Acidobacteria bacterium]|nr:ATP synthase F0 subunit C [Acidobacteriota bacterium]
MSKFKIIFFSALAILVLSTMTFAQVGAGGGGGGGIAANESTVAAYKALAAGLGFGIAAGLGALGQGRIGAAAVEGAARNPGAAGTVQTLMIIGLALIESLVLFALVIVFVVLR